MKKYLFLILSLASLSGCTMGTIDSGDVGVRREFNGSILDTPIDTGFYFWATGSVKEFTARQVDISFAGDSTLKPKAADNLSMQEFDCDVYYTTSRAKIPYLVVKYTNEDQEISKGIYAVAFQWVAQQANSASQSIVSQYDSLSVNKNRDKIAVLIQQELQRRLDEENPGAFHVDNVVIQNVVTDPSIEQAIQRNVNAQKELETAQIQQKINEQVAKNNQAVSQSITPQILAQRQLDILDKMAAAGRLTIVNVSDGTKGGVPIILNPDKP
jgi:hypothetical protein